MAKLSKEQAKKAIELKKEGETYRDIQEKLIKEYGEGNVPNFSTISTRIKPILEGEKTLEEVFSEQKQTKQENKTEQKEDVSSPEDLKMGDVGEEEQDEDYPILAILWVLFIVLVLLVVMIY